MTIGLSILFAQSGNVNDRRVGQDEGRNLEMQPMRHRNIHFLRHIGSSELRWGCRRFWHLKANHRVMITRWDKLAATRRRASLVSINADLEELYSSAESDMLSKHYPDTRLFF